MELTTPPLQPRDVEAINRIMAGTYKVGGTRVCVANVLTVVKWSYATPGELPPLSLDQLVRLHNRMDSSIVPILHPPPFTGEVWDESGLVIRGLRRRAQHA